MNSKKPSRKQILHYCADVHAEDGVDPRELVRNTSTSRKRGRKTLQLCGQVADTLRLVLANECADDVLRNLDVVLVEPCPNGVRLLVTVQPLLPDETTTAEQILDCLQAVAGKLRWEVAAAITRKRAPDLLFRVAVPDS